MGMVKLGLFGNEGHQVFMQSLLHPEVELCGIGGIAEEACPDEVRDSKIQFFDEWDRFIASGLDAVSLCVMPLRKRYEYTMDALSRGIHVFSEKPCAMTPDEVSSIVECACSNQVIFREMGGSAFGEPYKSIRKLVMDGKLGSVIQIQATKSYPWAQWRPREDSMDGGLSRQVAIHAVRWVEHISGDKINQFDILETQKGIKENGPDVLASVMYGSTESGAVFSISCNYLNSPKAKYWGRGSLKIFGDIGSIEVEEGDFFYRITTLESPERAVNCPPDEHTWFDYWIDEIMGKNHFPNTLEEDISPTMSLLTANLNKKRICTVS